MSDITLHDVKHHSVEKVTLWRKKDGCKLVVEIPEGRLFITKAVHPLWNAERLGRELKRNGYVTSKNLFENFQELL